MVDAAYIYAAGSGAANAAYQPNRNGSYEDRVMADKALPSPEVLRQLLRYEAETGLFFWLPRGQEWFAGSGRSAEWSSAAWNARHAGAPAFRFVTKYGYLSGHVFKQGLLAHRVAYAHAHGIWPDGQIDHINGNKTDNRIKNLRAVTDAENKKNMAMRKDNTSGIVGVGRHSRGKWLAQMGVNGRVLYLGVFDKVEDAISARRAAEVAHGFHRNHGRGA